MSGCPFCGAIVGLSSLAAAASLAVAACGPAATPEATTPPPVTVTPAAPTETSGGSATTEPLDAGQPELPDAGDVLAIAPTPDAGVAQPAVVDAGSRRAVRQRPPQRPEPEPQLLYGIDMKKP